MTLPVAIVGAGPVGLTTALGLAHYGIDCVLFEDEERLSTETKAGTTLSRSLEIWRRFGAHRAVLARSMRVDEIGDIERATNRSRRPVRLSVLAHETRFPFVINLPQQDMEPALAEGLHTDLRFGHRLIDFEQKSQSVMLEFENGKTFEAAYLLACDGGRSTIRAQLGVAVEGESWDLRCLLVDVKVDLDVANPRDYPYLAYFADPSEWMILVRQPHCWRFLYPLAAGMPEPTAAEFREKIIRFVGPVDDLQILNTIVYRIHHRVAREWRRDRVFLMGDAAHLITPMWALGLNTGILDAISLPWRLAWVARGWASDALLDGYAREQRPVAAEGSSA